MSLKGVINVIIDRIFSAFFLSGIIMLIILAILFFSGNSKLLNGEGSFLLVFFVVFVIIAVWAIFSSPISSDPEYTIEERGRFQQEDIYRAIEAEKEKRQRETIISLENRVSELEAQSNGDYDDEYDDINDRSYNKRPQSMKNEWVDNYVDVLFGRTREGRSKRR